MSTERRNIKFERIDKAGQPVIENVPVKTETLMDQYAASKARYPKHLLFFRIGDFYELFNEDAQIISKALGLTLTARNTVAKGETPIPMAGVPVHSAEAYIARLLRQGFSVAVVDPNDKKPCVKSGEEVCAR